MSRSITVGVHYPSGTDVCRAAWIIRDNPPDFVVADMVHCAVVAGVVTWTPHANVSREPNPSIPPTAGMWHYADECPYGLN